MTNGKLRGKLHETTPRWNSTSAESVEFRMNDLDIQPGVRTVWKNGKTCLLHFKLLRKKHVIFKCASKSGVSSRPRYDEIKLTLKEFFFCTQTRDNVILCWHFFAILSGHCARTCIIVKCSWNAVKTNKEHTMIRKIVKLRVFFLLFQARAGTSDRRKPKILRKHLGPCFCPKTFPKSLTKRPLNPLFDHKKVNS